MRKLIAFAAAVSTAAGGVAANEPVASDATRAAQAHALASLPKDDEDVDFASRGFIVAPGDPLIRNDKGAVVWNMRAYEFVDGAAPDTVNPSLWRHTGLLAKHGLFKVHERIYQVRGFDLANMSIILGDTGFIIVDPLTSVETARAALDLARAHLGDRPVVAVIYTHSHADHFAGVKGVINAEDAASGKVRVIAPEGFLEHSIAENIIAGPAMGRRAGFQFGAKLSPGEGGSMGSGIGLAVSAGTRSLIAPNDIVTKTGGWRMIDGVRFEFQLTPDTEAPAELNFHIPEFKALCLAENANATMHNVLTPRGALVRDSKRWADYLTEALRLYGGKSEIMFNSHAWPRFGASRVDDFIASHRDAYKYLHDQTVRMMNRGMTGKEIADAIALPEPLYDRWFNRGYYGTMRHNSRAVYQRYMGWYDGNPARLNPHPEEKTAPLYVEAMGGAKKVKKRARAAIEAGDYRWAAELLDIAVFADAEDEEARRLLAETHEQMAYQAESSLWRNMYLSAATELHDGAGEGFPISQSADFIAATPTEMLFDLLAVRLIAEKAPAEEMRLNFAFPERKETVAVSIRNGVLVHEENYAHSSPAATIAMPRAAFLGAMFAGMDMQPKIDGDAAAWTTFRTLFETPPQNFNIVTP
ncbi:MAG TPA: alkyl sulfatase dimerization domain-containing protein [Parvularculaceae bacterium]|nr:alkyl sulfatase dimerization domain-containing protein [Parvularculaceae bacterium]